MTSPWLPGRTPVGGLTLLLLVSLVLGTAPAVGRHAITPWDSGGIFETRAGIAPDTAQSSVRTRRSVSIRPVPARAAVVLRDRPDVHRLAADDAQRVLALFARPRLPGEVYEPLVSLPPPAHAVRA